MTLRLGLQQVLDMHRQQGRRVFSPIPPGGGEFDVGIYTVPDAEQARLDPEAWKNGRRDFREIRHNLLTNWMLETLSQPTFTWDGDFGIFISNDEKPAHKFKEYYRHTNPDSSWRADTSWDANGPSWTWTITSTILAPTATKVRKFRTVGITNDRDVAWGSNSWAIDTAVAATLLSALQTQTDVQQVVVSYRLAWEVPRNV